MNRPTQRQLEGARLCIACLCGSTLGASIAAFGFAFGVMTTPLTCSAVAVVSLLMLTGCYACTLR